MSRERRHLGSSETGSQTPKPPVPPAIALQTNVRKGPCAAVGAVTGLRGGSLAQEAPSTTGLGKKRPPKEGASATATRGGGTGTPLLLYCARGDDGKGAANRRSHGLDAPSPARPASGGTGGHGRGDNVLGFSRVIVNLGAGTRVHPLPTKVREGKKG